MPLASTTRPGSIASDEVMTDLYPLLREVMVRHHLQQDRVDGLPADRGGHSENDRGDSVYEGGSERVRTEIMAAFGYFHTESSHHASEYLPYFRKETALIESYIPNRWDYYEVCAAHDETRGTKNLLARMRTKLAPSLEYGAQIVYGMETDCPPAIYGNVANRELIPNLPAGCCVEVPCLVDHNGVQPTMVGALPPQCAAVTRTNINVEELAVEAALTGELEHVYDAVMLDPLAGALLTLKQIRAMVDELLDAEAAWLPDSVLRSLYERSTDGE